MFRKPCRIRLNLGPYEDVILYSSRYTLYNIHTYSSNIHRMLVKMSEIISIEQNELDIRPNNKMTKNINNLGYQI